MQRSGNQRERWAEALSVGTACATEKEARGGNCLSFVPKRKGACKEKGDVERLVDHTNLSYFSGRRAGAGAFELGLKGGVEMGSGRGWHRGQGYG